MLRCDENSQSISPEIPPSLLSVVCVCVMKRADGMVCWRGGGDAPLSLNAWVTCCIRQFLCASHGPFVVDTIQPKNVRGKQSSRTIQTN